MKDELLGILERLQKGDQALINAHDEVLDLFSVMKAEFREDSTIKIDLKTKNNKSLFVTAGVTTFIWIVLVLLLRYIINKYYTI